jgi:predicted metalloprotease with PDZ domain
LPAVEGVLIAQVKSYSPVDDAGLRNGDIIEAIDGNRINNPSQISSQIHKKHVSDQILIRLIDTAPASRFHCNFTRDLNRLEDIQRNLAIIPTSIVHLVTGKMRELKIPY